MDDNLARCCWPEPVITRGLTWEEMGSVQRWGAVRHGICLTQWHPFVPYIPVCPDCGEICDLLHTCCGEEVE